MKKLRLRVLPPDTEELEEATKYGNLSEKDKAIVAEQMTFSYKKRILSIMYAPMSAEKGISLEEIERGLHIVEMLKLTEEDGVLELDDDDFELILQKLRAVRFNSFDVRWVRLKKDLQNATKDLLDETDRKLKVAS